MSVRSTILNMRVGLAVAGCVVSVILGAVMVRLGLDWADTFPYSPASEQRYLGVAVVAVVVALGGSAGSIVAAVRSGRRHPGRTRRTR